jgi:hypothetical protein
LLSVNKMVLNISMKQLYLSQGGKQAFGLSQKLFPQHNLAYHLLSSIINSNWDCFILNYFFFFC